MKRVIIVLCFIFFGNKNYAQATVGLLTYGNGDLPGYFLVAPNSSTTTYLIDKCGYKINEWPSAYVPGQASYLMNDGSLIRAGNLSNATFTGGGQGGIIEKIDWAGNVVWSYTLSSTMECMHHDFKVMPNGNVLAIVWEKKSSAIAIAQGRDPALVNANLWAEKIIEIQPTGTSGGIIVWQWSNWNHVVQDFDNTKPNYGVVADHPELFNLNYLNGANAADWMHFNGIDYNAALDQIIISSRKMCEVYVIDHSTNTAEATSHTGGNSGKGGDILFRWGNPMAYNRGVLTDRKLFFQHCPTWIPSGYPNAGKIMVYNNGQGRPAGNYSTVDVIEPPIDMSGNYTISTGQAFGPSNLFWTYADAVPLNFYSGIVSGAYKMPNANVFITMGQTGLILEVDSLGNKLWAYQNSVNASGPLTQGSATTNNGVFKSNFYDLNFAGFVGKNLTPGLQIELNPLTYSCTMATLGIKNEIKFENVVIYPNPTNSNLTIENVSAINVDYVLRDAVGKKVLGGKTQNKNTELNLAELESGIYFLEINNRQTKKIIKE